MTNQDKRAVESMCRCGISLQGLIDSFPLLDKDEVEAVYDTFRKMSESVVEIPAIKMNCS